ncbi:hypothetical protein AnigIFM63309_006420 [Aspergillus niger]|nr:hypothetical protein AnigIFM63309_006420 [Aspergillus niger]
MQYTVIAILNFAFQKTGKRHALISRTKHRYAQAIGTRDAVDFENALAASIKASKAALFQSPSARNSRSN